MEEDGRGGAALGGRFMHVPIVAVPRAAAVVAKIDIILLLIASKNEHAVAAALTFVKHDADSVA